MPVPFKTVDVFTAVPFKGNPVAVVLDAGRLDGAQMQQIARWTNLSETTFVIPATVAGADYHVRIFTPGGELPFAGHPTIGTAHALLDAGMVAVRDGVLVQQCGAGLVQLRVTPLPDGERSIAFELPSPTLTTLDATARAELAAILGAPAAGPAAPCLVDVGARWVVVQLPSAAAVLALQPDLARLTVHDLKRRHTGVIVFGPHPPGSPARLEVRAFAPAHGVPEDPVCGSGNGAMAAYLRHTGQAAAWGSDFAASQGAVLGRAGRIALSVTAEAIWVGGQAITCIDGSLRL